VVLRYCVVSRRSGCAVRRYLTYGFSILETTNN